MVAFMALARISNSSLPFFLTVTLAILSGCSQEQVNLVANSRDPSSVLSGADASTGRLETAAASSSTSIPSTAMAARILFSSGSSGSFDSPSSGGTANAYGSGLQAERLYKPNGDLLASSTSSTDWPTWISSVELGISGSKNTAATNVNCARFAESNEDTSATCNFDTDDATAAVSCGAPSSVFRVSDFDCNRGTITDGAGSSSDGVYVRVTFNRDTAALGSTENVMAVLEYSASVINNAPANPTKCFQDGKFTPASSDCTDILWQSYLKKSSTETATPFLMLVPPAIGFVDSTNNRGGSGVATKQFILPLSNDSTYSIFQISRTFSRSDTGATTNFYKMCNGAANPSNSPLCVGMILYSLTLYRI